MNLPIGHNVRHEHEQDDELFRLQRRVEVLEAALLERGDRKIILHSLDVTHEEIRSLAVGLSSLRQESADHTEMLARLLSGHEHLSKPARGLRLYIGEQPMAATTLDVDVTNKVLVVAYEDDKGDVTPTGPDGATLSFTSSDPSVTTVDATGALTFNKAGSATYTVDAVDATGTPIPGFEAAVDIVLTPGAASQLMASIGDGAPVPVDPGPPPAPAP